MTVASLRFLIYSSSAAVFSSGVKGEIAGGYCSGGGGGEGPAARGRPPGRSLTDRSVLNKKLLMREAHSVWFVIPDTVQLLLQRDRLI